jgi:hypothetical protein
MAREKFMAVSSIRSSNIFWQAFSCVGEEWNVIFSLGKICLLRVFTQCKEHDFE